MVDRHTRNNDSPRRRRPESSRSALQEELPRSRAVPVESSELPRAPQLHESSSSYESSSSSYIDISRTLPPQRTRGLSAIRAFFTSPSERRRVRRRRSRAILPFGNSSSTSVNSDLAYGTGYIRRRKGEVRKGKRRERDETASGQADGLPPRRRRSADLRSSRPSGRASRAGLSDDAAILALGAEMAALAREQNRQDMKDGRKSGSIPLAGQNSARMSGAETSRGLGPSRVSHGPDEEGWESATDADSETSSVDSKLAYGHSRGKGYAGRRRPQRKESIVDPALFGPANSLHGLLQEPVGFHDEIVDHEYLSDFVPPTVADSQKKGMTPSAAPPSSTRSGPMQYVYPIPTSDPNSFDAVGSSVFSGQEPYIPRPGPTVIQAPQPILPVTSSVLEPSVSTRDAKVRTGRPNSLASAALAGVAGAAIIGATMSSDTKGDRKDGKRRDEPRDKYRDDVRIPNNGREKPRERRRENAEDEDREKRRERRREKERERELVGRRDEPDKERQPKRREEDRGRPDDTRSERQREKLPAIEAAEKPEKRREPIDPFQFQVADDAFITPDGTRNAEPITSIKRARSPAIVTVERVPHFARPRVSSAGDKLAEPIGDAKGEKDREIASEKDQDDGREEERGRDRKSREMERESRDRERIEREADQIYEETRHFTAPLDESAINASVAVEMIEEDRKSRSSKGKRRRKIESKNGEEDPIQAEANRIYRETIRAQKIAAEHNDDPIPRIKTPPEMAHKKAASLYDAPNADFELDHVTDAKEVQTSPIKQSFPADRSIDPTAIVALGSLHSMTLDSMKRPLLNLIRPTPSPSPAPEQQRSRSERRESSQSEASKKESPAEETREVEPVVNDVPAKPADTPVRRSTSTGSGKGVTWGKNETMHYNVESPDDRKDDPMERSVQTSDVKEKPKMSAAKKASAWGALKGAFMSGAAAEVVAKAEEAAKRSQDAKVEKEIESERPRSEKGADYKISAPDKSTRAESATSEKSVGSGERKNSKDRSFEYRGVVVEPDNEDRDTEDRGPPPIGPKPSKVQSSQMPGAFEDDIDFTATIAAGLERSGFDPEIVIKDPTYRRRSSPPGSQEPVAGYKQPYSETVSDLGSYVDVSSTEKARDFKAENDSLSRTKVSDKEQRKLDKAAKRQSRDFESPKEFPVSSQIVEEPETYAVSSQSGKKDRKRDGSEKSDRQEKSKRSKDLYDDDLPREKRSSKVTIPVDAFDDLRSEISRAVTDDGSSTSKRSKRSKAGDDQFDPPSRSMSTSDMASSMEKSSKKSKEKSSKRSSRSYDSEPNPEDVPLPTASEVSRDSRDDGRESRRSSKSSKRSASIPDTLDRDTRSAKSSNSKYEDAEDSKKKDKKSGGGGGFFGIFGSSTSKSSEPDRERSKDKEEYSDPKKSKKSKRNSTADGTDISEVSVTSNGNGYAKHDNDYGEKKKAANGNSKSGKADGNEESFLGNAGTLGAGVGLVAAVAIAAQQHQQSKAAHADIEETARSSSGPRDFSMPQQSALENADDIISKPMQEAAVESAERDAFQDDTIDPDITQRHSRMCLDPYFGDYLPLPPSDPSSPTTEPNNDLPELPASQPGTPPRSEIYTSRKSVPPLVKTPSTSAIPIQYFRNRSTPSSPALSRPASMTAASPSPMSPDALTPLKVRPRPVSWDSKSTKEIRPLLLLDPSRSGSTGHSSDLDRAIEDQSTDSERPSGRSRRSSRLSLLEEKSTPEEDLPKNIPQPDFPEFAQTTSRDAVDTPLKHVQSRHSHSVTDFPHPFSLPALPDSRKSTPAIDEFRTVDPASFQLPVSRKSTPGIDEPQTVDPFTLPQLPDSRSSTPAIDESRNVDPASFLLPISRKSTPAVDEFQVIDPASFQLPVSRKSTPAIDDPLTLPQLPYSRQSTPAIEEPQIIDPASFQLPLSRKSTPAIVEPRNVDPASFQLPVSRKSTPAIDEPQITDPTIFQLPISRMSTPALNDTSDLPQLPDSRSSTPAIDESRNNDPASFQLPISRKSTPAIDDPSNLPQLPDSRELTPAIEEPYIIDPASLQLPLSRKSTPAVDESQNVDPASFHLPVSRKSTPLIGGSRIVDPESLQLPESGLSTPADVLDISALPALPPSRVSTPADELEFIKPSSIPKSEISKSADDKVHDSSSSLAAAILPGTAFGVGAGALAPSVSHHDEHKDTELHKTLPVEDLPEEFRVEPDTKDRSSYLFQATPPAKGLGIGSNDASPVVHRRELETVSEDATADDDLVGDQDSPTRLVKRGREAALEALSRPTLGDTEPFMNLESTRDATVPEASHVESDTADVFSFTKSKKGKKNEKKKMPSQPASEGEPVSSVGAPSYVADASRDNTIHEPFVAKSKKGKNKDKRKAWNVEDEPSSSTTSTPAIGSAARAVDPADDLSAPLVEPTTTVSTDTTLKDPGTQPELPDKKSKKDRKKDKKKAQDWTEPEAQPLSSTAVPSAIASASQEADPSDEPFSTSKKEKKKDKKKGKSLSRALTWENTTPAEPTISAQPVDEKAEQTPLPISRALSEAGDIGDSEVKNRDVSEMQVADSFDEPSMSKKEKQRGKKKGKPLSRASTWENTTPAEPVDDDFVKAEQTPLPISRALSEAGDNGDSEANNRAVSEIQEADPQVVEQAGPPYQNKQAKKGKKKGRNSSQVRENDQPSIATTSPVAETSVELAGPVELRGQDILRAEALPLPLSRASSEAGLEDVEPVIEDYSPGSLDTPEAVAEASSAKNSEEREMTDRRDFESGEPKELTSVKSSGVESTESVEPKPPPGVETRLVEPLKPIGLTDEDLFNAARTPLPEPVASEELIQEPTENAIESPEAKPKDPEIAQLERSVKSEADPFIAKKPKGKKKKGKLAQTLEPDEPSVLEPSATAGPSETKPAQELLTPTETESQKPGFKEELVAELPIQEHVADSTDREVWLDDARGKNTTASIDDFPKPTKEPSFVTFSTKESKKGKKKGKASQSRTEDEASSLGSITEATSEPTTAAPSEREDMSSFSMTPSKSKGKKKQKQKSVAWDVDEPSKDPAREGTASFQDSLLQEGDKAIKDAMGSAKEPSQVLPDQSEDLKAVPRDRESEEAIAQAKELADVEYVPHEKAAVGDDLEKPSSPSLTSPWPILPAEPELLASAYTESSTADYFPSAASLHSPRTQRDVEEAPEKSYFPSAARLLPAVTVGAAAVAAISLHDTDKGHDSESRDAVLAASTEQPADDYEENMQSEKSPHGAFSISREVGTDDSPEPALAMATSTLEPGLEGGLSKQAQSDHFRSTGILHGSSSIQPNEASSTADYFPSATRLLPLVTASTVVAKANQLEQSPKLSETERENELLPPLPPPQPHEQDQLLEDSKLVGPVVDVTSKDLAIDSKYEASESGQIDTSVPAGYGAGEAQADQSPKRRFKKKQVRKDTLDTFAHADYLAQLHEKPVDRAPTPEITISETSPEQPSQGRLTFVEGPEDELHDKEVPPGMESTDEHDRVEVSSIVAEPGNEQSQLHASIDMANLNDREPTSGPSGAHNEGKQPALAQDIIDPTHDTMEPAQAKKDLEPPLEVIEPKSKEKQSGREKPSTVAELQKEPKLEVEDLALPSEAIESKDLEPRVNPAESIDKGKDRDLLAQVNESSTEVEPSADNQHPDGLATGHNVDQVLLAKQLQEEFSAGSKKSKKGKKSRGSSTTPKGDSESNSINSEVPTPVEGQRLTDDLQAIATEDRDDSITQAPDGLAAGFTQEQLEAARQMREDFSSGSKKSKKGKKRQSLIRTATDDNVLGSTADAVSGDASLTTNIDSAIDSPLPLSSAATGDEPDPFAFTTKKGKKGSKKRQSLSQSSTRESEAIADPIQASSQNPGSRGLEAESKDGIPTAGDLANTTTVFRDEPSSIAPEEPESELFSYTTKKAKKGKRKEQSASQEEQALPEPTVATKDLPASEDDPGNLDKSLAAGTTTAAGIAALEFASSSKSKKVKKGRKGKGKDVSEPITPQEDVSQQTEQEVVEKEQLHTEQPAEEGSMADKIWGSVVTTQTVPPEPEKPSSNESEDPLGLFPDKKSKKDKKNKKGKARSIPEPDPEPILGQSTLPLADDSKPQSVLLADEISDNTKDVANEPERSISLTESSLANPPALLDNSSQSSAMPDHKLPDEPLASIITDELAIESATRDLSTREPRVKPTTESITKDSSIAEATTMPTDNRPTEIAETTGQLAIYQVSTPKEDESVMEHTVKGLLTEQISLQEPFVQESMPQEILTQAQSAEDLKSAPSPVKDHELERKQASGALTRDLDDKPTNRSHMTSEKMEYPIAKDTAEFDTRDYDKKSAERKAGSYVLAPLQEIPAPIENGPPEPRVAVLDKSDKRKQSIGDVAASQKIEPSSIDDLAKLDGPVIEEPAEREKSSDALAIAAAVATGAAGAALLADSIVRHSKEKGKKKAEALPAAGLPAVAETGIAKAPSGTKSKKSKKGKERAKALNRSVQEEDIFDDPMLWEGAQPQRFSERSAEMDDRGDGDFWSAPVEEEESAIDDTAFVELEPLGELAHKRERSASLMAAEEPSPSLDHTKTRRKHEYEDIPAAIARDVVLERETIHEPPTTVDKPNTEPETKDISDNVPLKSSKKTKKNRKQNRIEEWDAPEGVKICDGEASSQPIEEPTNYRRLDPNPSQDISRSAAEAISEIHTGEKVEVHEPDFSSTQLASKEKVSIDRPDLNERTFEPEPENRRDDAKARRRGQEMYIPPPTTLPVVIEEEASDHHDTDRALLQSRPKSGGRDVGDKYRDSGLVTGSPVPLQRAFAHNQEHARDSGVHMGDTPKLRSPATFSDDALARLSWPSVDEKTETVDLTRSQRQKTDQSSVGHIGSVVAAGALTAAAVHLASRALRTPPKERQEKREGEGLERTISPNIGRLQTPDHTKFRPSSVGSNRSSQVSNRSGGSTPGLRRSDRKLSSDLRSLSQRSQANLANDAKEAATKESEVSPATSAVNLNPIANEGRVRVKDMADVYDGFGEGRIGSPMSPTRPHSMRRRQSMQVLDLERRIDDLAAENRMLAEAKEMADRNLSSAQRATLALADREAEVDNLKQTLDWLQREVERLKEVNDGLDSANAQLARQHNDRYGSLEAQHTETSRELDEMRHSHGNLTAAAEAMILEKVTAATAEKDREISRLMGDLDNAQEKIRDLQRQILETKSNDGEFLVIRDEDYFDNACQQLCQHVQQWVLRFSKFSDMRACRLTSEINNDKIIDRLDNAVLDGSDVDKYLSDRVKRRDIFMSMTMTMIWEYVFTRYLFGMDREQRQKLKTLEKTLMEVGPQGAVHQWRATTLALLAKRKAFQAQREQDTEAVVLMIFQTLSEILPPPSQLEVQIQQQLNRVMKAAVDLSIEMRTQRAEYMMLPPLQPEYDANGELSRQVFFNAALMNERSGDTVSNEDLEAGKAIVRVVLFPLVVKKGDDNGNGDEEIVVCPAQVLVAKSRKQSRHGSGAVGMVQPNHSTMSMQSGMPVNPQDLDGSDTDVPDI